MDVNNRTRLERKLAEELAKLSGEQLRKILAKMGDPPDVDNLPEGIWTSWAQDLRDALGPFLLSVAQAQAKEFADGIPQAAGTIDWALANREAREWAQAYTFDLVGGIIDHSRESVDKGLQAVLRTAIGQGAGGEGGRWSIADVTDALSPYFGPVRSEMIAVTEITRASAEAESRLVDQLGAAGIDLVAVWNTREDELVCPICGGFDGTEADENGQWVTDEGETVDNPPAHPRCRCFVTHRIVDTGAKSTPPKKKPTAADKFTWKAGDLVLGPAPTVKGFNPDQPRDERGRFGEGSGGGAQGDAQGGTQALQSRFDAARAKKDADVRANLVESQKEWSAGVTAAERYAIQDYAGTGFQPINSYLREDGDPDYLDSIKALDDVLARATVPEDVMVLRGSEAFPGWEDLAPGQTFTDKGYVSTSVGQPFSGPLQFAIMVPKGSKAGYLPGVKDAARADEKELLLPRGASFQILNVEAMGYHTVVHAVYMGSVDPATKAKPRAKEDRAARFAWEAGDFEVVDPAEAKGYNPDQPRDASGRFGSGGGAGTGSATGGAQTVDAQGEAVTPERWAAAAKDLDADRVLDNGDARDWGRELSEDELSAIGQYQSAAYRPINQDLRGGQYRDRGADGIYAERTMDQVAALDAALARTSTPEDAIVRRGIRGEDVLGGVKPGAVIRDKGFVSTSTGSGFYGGAMFEILVPKGSNAGYLNAISSNTYKNEQELLLPRGASFKVESVGPHPDPKYAGVTFVRATYLGSKPQDPKPPKRAKATKAQDVPKHNPAKFVWKPEDVVVAWKGTKGFDPDQPRDERGRFGSGGGSPSADGAQGGRPVDVGANGKPLPKLGGYYASDACQPWKDEQLAACNFEKQGYDKTPLRFPIPETPEGILAGEKAHAALVAGMDNRAGLSLDHASAITYYQGAGAYDVNKPLRADKGDAKRADEEAGNLASVLSDAIDRTKTPVDVVVYRGAPKGTPDVGVGDTFTDHAFVSATTSPHVADQFSGHAVDNGTEFVLTIPKGTNAVYVDAMGGDQKPPWNGQTPTRQVPLAYERELILQRGSSFRVDRVEVVKDESGGSRRYLYATHVGDAGPVKALAVKAQDVDPQDRRDKWIWKAGDLVLGAGPLIMGSEAKGAPDQPRDEAGRFASTDGFGADPGATGAAQVEGRVAGSPGKDGSGRWVSSRSGPSEPDYKGMDRPLLFSDPTAGAWESTHAELMKAGDIRDQLEPFHARAIAYYQSSGYAYANDLQRQGKPEQADAYGGVAGLVTILSDAVDRSRVPADVVVMRGAVDDKATGFAKLKPGQTFTDKGFVSTSASPATAESFMDTDPSSGAKNVQMVLTIPKGTNGLYVDALAGAKPWKGGAMPQDTPYGEERELLLQRGSSFRVDKVETVKAKFGGTKITRIHATHVGDSGRYVEHATKAYNPDQPRDELGRFGQTPNPVGRESADALDAVAELATSGATAHAFRRVSTSADMSPYDGTDADVQAVHTYETPQYRNIADELRYGRDKGAAADIVALDRLMESGALGTRTTKDVVVLRGLSSIPGRPNTEAMVNELKAAPPGFAFEDNSFCSTTVDPSISERFGSRPDRETALVKVLVPKGSRAVYSNWSGESELILDRGGRFVVAGHERGPGGEHIINVIHAERMVKDKAPVGAKSAKAQDAQDAQDVDRFAWSASQIVILRSLGPLERSRAAQGDA